MENISARLKEFAKHVGSDTILAGLLSMTPQALSSYTSGRSLPGAKILLKLHYLGCDINWLLSGEGAMLRKDAPVITNIEEKKEELSIEERMERLEKAVFALTKDKDKKTSSRRALRATAGKENSYV